MSIAKPSATGEPEQAVRTRYAAAARQLEPELCCPVEYRREYLAAIPAEILERDYGCGDPTAYVRPGETVLDLGSGGGKICYIAAQIVGRAGRVIGVDCNDEMLDLARRHQPAVAERLGYDVVEFRRGLIQDLRLDLDLLAEELARQPVNSPERWLELRSLEESLRQERPLIADASVDCVVSNCVLNLVRRQDRAQLLAEVYRVLRDGGRAAISDIVADRDVPEGLRQDARLWSGCISGAFREDQFLEAFAEAGFHGVRIAERGSEPWREVEGIEFRSLTVVGYKGKQGPCIDRQQAVIYRGPFKNVEDDDGHVFTRGRRTPVCEKTFKLLAREPYQGNFEPVARREETPATIESRPSDLPNAEGLAILPRGGEDCGQPGCC
jgi:arsenite methyltransferase